jgi:hypothetical protein
MRMHLESVWEMSARIRNICYKDDDQYCPGRTDREGAAHVHARHLGRFVDIGQKK